MTPFPGDYADVPRDGPIAVHLSTRSHTQGGTNLMVSKLFAYCFYIVYGFVHYRHCLLLIAKALM